MLTHPFFHALDTLDYCLLRSNQSFYGLPLIHPAIPRSNLGKTDRETQERRGVESTGKNVFKKFGKISPNRCQSSA
ncbi:MAG TPA: hypothetical protein VKR06_10020 [Ktedonosporobacter sp.]|nr:hypothetical protein [Ktedonosporobacter sp.]